MIEKRITQCDNFEIQDTPDVECLRNYLKIIAPKVEDTSPALSFGRSKFVEILWREIFDVNNSPYETGDGNEHWRSYFDEIWGITLTWEIDQQGKLDPVISPEDSKLLRDMRLRGGDGELHKSTVIMKPDGNSHTYKFQSKSEGPYFEEDDFDDGKKYLKFWSKVDRIKIGVHSSHIIEIVDLSPRTIIQKINQLYSTLEVARKISNHADAIAESQLNELLTKEGVDRIVSRFREMKAPKENTYKELRRLRDQAFDLGYYFSIMPTEYTYPDGTTVNLEDRELFQPYRNTFSRTHERQRQVIKKLEKHKLDNDNQYLVESNIKMQRLFEKASARLNEDVVTEMEDRLQHEGYVSYRFERKGNMYQNVHGEFLTDVLRRCHKDKAFCDQCAVWLPIYEEKLTEGEVLSKYIVIRRPLMGLQPMHLPEIYIEEELSLELSPNRIELGELAHSINLAPGEKRTVIIERTTTEESELRSAANSLVDIASDERLDFGTEFEKEARRSKDQTQSSNWSVKAGGSFGYGSISAKGGGSSSIKTNQFAREVGKYSRKASKSLTQKTKMEVSSTESHKTSVATKDSLTLEISNINEGRTLNLLFFQLYNVRDTSLILKNLRFVALSGVESILGSGYVLPKEFLIDDIDGLLQEVLLHKFPVKFKNNMPDHEENYLNIILNSIINSLREYDYKDGFDSSSKTIEIENLKKARKEPNVQEKFKLLKKGLSNIKYRKNKIQSDLNLRVGSGGLYVDSFVGARPAAEPYAEQMRCKEIQMRDAEIQEKIARSAWYRNAASRIGNAPVGFTVNATALSTTRLSLEFSDEPIEGVWELSVNNVVVQELEVLSSKLHYIIDFESPQSWLTSDSAELGRLEHTETNIQVHFMV